MIIDANTELDVLTQTAIDALSDVKSGEEFIVKELFRGFEWNRIPKGNRTKLGSVFFAHAKGELKDVIEPLGKTPQNQQIYKKL